MSSIATQVAALPLRWNDQGRLRILMVTSRCTGRWVMPKGWTMEGKKLWRAAEIEALEEAGVTGHISHVPIGDYHYDKVLGDGTTLPCRVTLFPLVVDGVKRRWKERHERARRWFSIKGAARAVNEPDLVDILSGLTIKPGKHPVLGPLRRAC
jgi:8-oxo-dGTP pyrophosphatase MutT (NUDIX family)